MSKEQGNDGAVAFFDLDRTLIDVNSGLLYVRHERRHGRIGRFQMAQSALWMLLYHLSLIDMEKAYARALGHYRGTPEAVLESRTREWFADEVAHRLQPGAQQAMDRHRERGHPLVVLTNSSSYAAREAMRTWGLDDWLANRFPTDDQGRLEGTYEAPLCYGPGKVVRAERWVESRGATLSRSYFYTDSYSDRAMLEAVGNPRVVNPDPRLRRLARKRGWPIVDWTSASQVG